MESTPSQLLCQSIKEHPVSLLALLEAGKSKEFIGRVHALVSKTKGENDGIGVQVLQEQGVYRDSSARAYLIGRRCVKIAQ
jgi:hypothetical protein